MDAMASTATSVRTHPLTQKPIATLQREPGLARDERYLVLPFLRRYVDLLRDSSLVACGPALQETCSSTIQKLSCFKTLAPGTIVSSNKSTCWPQAELVLSRLP